MPLDKIIASTGKRKTSIARVLVQPGSGQITINRRPFLDYFPRETAQLIVKQPLELANLTDKVDILANVAGGGLSGQAEAVRHGIAKALSLTDTGLKRILRDHGLLTRDSRKKERKKYGQRGARARYQYSKR